MFVFVLLLCLVWSVQTNEVTVDQVACDVDQESTVQECLQPMLAYANQLQNEHGIEFALHGQHIFERLCSLYESFSACTQATQCSSISVRAIQASYGYMCGQGRAQFSEYVECFARVEQEDEYVHCKQSATQAIAALSQHRQQEQYLQQLCSIMTTYLQCSHQLIVAQCGTQAWLLVQRVTEDSLHVTMPQCDLTPVFR